MVTRSWLRVAALVAVLVGNSELGWGQASEIAKLLASDGANSDFFGSCVATSSETCIIGSPFDDDLGSGSGSAYVFVRSGGTWFQQAKLVAIDGSAGDQFGCSVSLDGDTALIGARGDDAQGENAGSAYVFVRNGVTWTQQEKLLAVDGASEDRFGESVSLAGTTAIVGAPFDDDLGSDSGSAYVFLRGESDWSQQAKLQAIDGVADDGFGGSVSLDGDTAIIGADGDDDGGVDSGSAYAFLRNGQSWMPQAKLVPGDGTAEDRFGCSVSVDGDTVLIGAYGDQNPHPYSGSAYAFVRSGGTWSEQAKLSASDVRADKWFGFSVALHDDTGVIGAHRDDAQGSMVGSAYLFVRSAGVWSQQTKLQASDAANDDQFGTSVSIDEDAVLVGSPHDDDAGGGSGSAYVFHLGGDPTEPRAGILYRSSVQATPHLATANSATHDLSLWTNDGTGTLSESRVALDPADRAPIALAAGDLDDDGFADDLAVACADSNSVARVLDLDGTPQASTQACGGLQPTCVAIGDLDADGRDEVVIGREGMPFAGGAGLAVSRNAGAFTELPIPNGHATRVQKLALLDLDGDGDNDLVALAHGSPDELLLFAGDGAGALVFADAIALPTIGFASGLCAGDLDGDGDIDLAVALATLFPLPATELRILSHDGSSALQASAYSLSPPIATGGVLATDLACGELEDDSIPGFLSRRDLIVVHGGSGDARVFSGWDGASFQGTRMLTVGQNPIAAAVGDLDGDGGDDVVIVNQGSSDLSVNLTVQPALAQTYGTGCPGTGALTPALAGSGTPLSGSSSFALELEQARSFAPTLLLYSFGLAELALGGGCALYLELPAGSLLLFTDGSGSATLGLSVPIDPLLLGGDAYFQAAVFDPAGAFAATLAFSNGVRLQVGS